MPRGRRKKTDQPQTVQLKASELKRAVDDTIRLQSQQSEYGGFAGRAKKGFCERTKMDPTVFGWLVGLKKLDNPLRAQEMLRQLNAGAIILGLHDQGDLFDEASARAKAAQEADELPPARPGGEGLPLDEAEKRFAENADKAPTPAEVDAKAEAKARRRRKQREVRPDATATEALREANAETDAWLKEQRGKANGGVPPEVAGQGSATGNDISDLAHA